MELSNMELSNNDLLTLLIAIECGDGDPARVEGLDKRIRMQLESRGIDIDKEM